MSAPFRIRSAGTLEVAEAPGDEFKGYLDRLLKLIPAEVVGLYLVGNGFIPVGERMGLAIWAAVCLIAVITVRVFATSDPQQNLSPQWAAVLISAISFIIWVYTMGGPFEAFGYHSAWIGSLAVLIWTFFVPIVYKGSPA
jgi:hypothetical protein